MSKKVYKLKTSLKPSNLKIDYQIELNEEQLAVVTRAQGPCLVLAGAGSGKTRTLVYRVAYLLEHGVKPENILLVTFTNKAAREMTSRVESLLKYTPQGMWTGTFHHIGNRILRKYIKKLGYNSNYTILDEADAQDLLKNIMADLTAVPDKYFPKAKVVKSIISFVVNSGQSIERVFSKKYPQLDPSLLEKIKIIAQRYQTKKKNLNVLDYDDLLRLWLKLLQDYPETQKVLSKTFQYILVDEYQDTNHLQANLIEKLTHHHGNVLVVGDDAQSIYSFRAADIDNILQFPKKFKPTTIFKLETNYRSTPEILDLANESIKHNREQFPKNLRAVKKSGQKPVIAALQNSDQQAKFITQRILEMNAAGTSLNDIAILFRADYQALELELELNKKSIPYSKRGGIRFFEQAHLKDIVAFLKIIDNPQDEISWTRVLLLQPGIGRVGANKILGLISNQSLTEIVKLKNQWSGGLATAWQEFTDLLNKLATSPREKIADIIQNIMDGFYFDYAQANFDNADKRLEDIEQLLNFSDQYSSLSRLLGDLTLSESYYAENVGADRSTTAEQLIITTIHQAKGLEWDRVFVMHLAQGQFPHARSLESAAELEEERRLFYVAATRAQSELYLLYPITTYSHSSGLIFTQPSVFIQELSSDRYEEWSVENESSDDLPTIEYLPDV